jgi:hypothetical protein
MNKNRGGGERNNKRLRKHMLKVNSLECNIGERVLENPVDVSLLKSTG